MMLVRLLNIRGNFDGTYRTRSTSPTSFPQLRRDGDFRLIALAIHVAEAAEVGEGMQRRFAERSTLFRIIFPINCGNCVTQSR